MHRSQGRIDGLVIGEQTTKGSGVIEHVERKKSHIPICHVYTVSPTAFIQTPLFKRLYPNASIQTPLSKRRIQHRIEQPIDQPIQHPIPHPIQPHYF